MKTPLLKASFLYFILSLTAFSFLISCKKDNGEEPLPPDNTTVIQPTCRVTKYYNEAKPAEYNIYQYDSQDKLVKVNSFYQGKETIITYEYNPQGQLASYTIKDKYLDGQQKLTVDVTDIYTFEYNAKGQVSKFIKTRPTPSTGNYAAKPSEGICEYDNEGNRTKVTHNTSGNPNPHIILYTYQDGNCIKEVIAPGTTSELITVNEFYLDKEDKLKSHYQNTTITNLTGPTASKNMRKRTVRTSQQNPDAFNYTYDYLHEFTDKGYPAKYITSFKTKAYSDNSTMIMEYQCR